MLRSRLASSLAAVALVVTATTAQASAHEDDSRATECIVFEDDSFVCGHATRGGWIDRTRPYVVGCIPDGGCNESYVVTDDGSAE